MQEKKKQINISRSTFNYYKPIITSNLNIEYKKKSYKNKKKVANSKTFFDKLYKKFDVIINLDGKSFEDIPNIQKNLSIKLRYKRVSQAVEIKS